jgi:scyllo-inositol 2-dehydrogenase (NADP+)
VIGYGLAGSVFHAPLIASTPGLAVSTVVTGNPQRQAEARQAHPDSQVLSDPAEVSESASEYDFVVVAAPNDVHVGLTRRASMPACRWWSTSRSPPPRSRPSRWWSKRRDSES